MLTFIHLFLPAIIPSWRFFDAIMPSPRVEVALLNAAGDEAANWHEFSPLPAHLSLTQMLIAIVWNPARNEALFLVSLAERIVAHDSAHAKREIAERVRRGLDSDHLYFQYRLVFVERQNNALIQEIVYVSDIYRANEMKAS